MNGAFQCSRADCRKALSDNEAWVGEITGVQAPGKVYRVPLCTGCAMRHAIEGNEIHGVLPDAVPFVFNMTDTE